jgi:hypothetical protein
VFIYLLSEKSNPYNRNIKYGNLRNLKYGNFGTSRTATCWTSRAARTRRD